ncbi:hypothetical protein EYF80_065286 [Liparis tanakae]|uniref:Uncharacterized protein n=1 Tax=Liparis tanakae TaxID=230148 RepID=A0A4Z2E703_9TELE|nr:hypothetical protein EYF80_065286 [Liparis tanakae]
MCGLVLFRPTPPLPLSQTCSVLLSGLDPLRAEATWPAAAKCRKSPMMFGIPSSATHDFDYSLSVRKEGFLAIEAPWHQKEGARHRGPGINMPMHTHRHAHTHKQRTGV